MTGLCLFFHHSCWFPESNRSAYFYVTLLNLKPLFVWYLFPLNQVQYQFLPLYCFHEAHSSWTCWPLSHALLQPNLSGPLSVRPTSVTHPCPPLSFSALSHSAFVSPQEPQAFFRHLQNISLHLRKIHSTFVPACPPISLSGDITRVCSSAPRLESELLSEKINRRG